MSSPAQVDYDKLAAQARTVDYDALAAQARSGAAPSTDGGKSHGAVLDWIYNTATHLPGAIASKVGEGLSSGLQVAQSTLQQAAEHPENGLLGGVVSTVGRGVVDNGRAQLHKAKESIDKGDNAAAAGHAAAALPFVGPMMASWNEDIKNGKPERVLADLLLLAAPAAASKLKIGVPSLRTMGAADAQAVDDLASKGVPIDAATATGNQSLKFVKKISDEGSVIGSVVSGKAREATNSALATIRDQLLAKSGGMSRSYLEAGADAAKRTSAAVKAGSATADSAYDALRTAEQNGQVVGVPLDRVRAVFQPIKDYLDKASKAAGLRPEGTAAKAKMLLDDFMSGDQKVVPLMMAEDALGTLKDALRSNPNQLGQGAGQLRFMVKTLQKEIDSAAKASSPNIGATGSVFDTLQAGRAATVAKYNAAKALEAVQGVTGERELGTAMKQLAAPNDGGIGKLRRVVAQSPESAAELASAYLNEITSASSTDGFLAHADKMAADFAKLGPETRKVLFKDALAKDPMYVRNLESLFRGAKLIKENVNPSGTGSAAFNAAKFGGAIAGGPAAWMAAGLEELAAGGMSKALRSPRIVRALVQGSSVRAGDLAGKAAAASVIAKAFQAEGLPVPAGFVAKDKE